MIELKNVLYVCDWKTECIKTKIMQLQEAIKIIKDHNKWRKGSDERPMIEPKELSQAIDLLIEFAEKKAILNATRRIGKTTRLIDDSIQTLFKERQIFIPKTILPEKLFEKGGKYFGKIPIYDPSSNKANRAQREFIDRLVGRLIMEHRDYYEIEYDGEYVLIKAKEI